MAKDQSTPIQQLNYSPLDHHCLLALIFITVSIDFNSMDFSFYLFINSSHILILFFSVFILVFSLCPVLIYLLIIS